MVEELSAEVVALVRRARRCGAADGERLEPLLRRLDALSQHGSASWASALCLVAEGIMERDPWRASILARRVLRVRSESHRAWALLGLAQSLLGHHRFSITAYRRARSLSPDNPFYAHNLGHLLDVVLDEPRRAVRLLEGARAALPDNDEVTASLAHALLRAGAALRAREAMRPVARRTSQPHHHELYRAILDRVSSDLTAHLTRGDPPLAARRRVLARRRTGRLGR